MDRKVGRARARRDDRAETEAQAREVESPGERRAMAALAEIDALGDDSWLDQPWTPAELAAIAEAEAGPKEEW